MAMPIVCIVSNNGYAQSDSPTQIPNGVPCNHSKKAINPPCRRRSYQAMP